MTANCCCFHCFLNEKSGKVYALLWNSAWFQMLWIFMQTMQIIFYFTNIQVLYIFLDNIWKICTYHTPYCYKVNNCQKQSFLAHPVYILQLQQSGLMHQCWCYCVCSLQKKYQICIDTGDAFHIHSKKRNVDIGDDLMITVIAVFSRVALIGRARSNGGQTGQLPSLPSTSRGASTKHTHTHATI